MVLIAVLAPSGSSQWQQKLCEKAITYLDECSLGYKIVDDEATRVKLFFDACMSPSYPQFFIQADSTGQITHLGNLDALECLVDRKSPLLLVGREAALVTDVPEYEDTTQSISILQRPIGSLKSSMGPLPLSSSGNGRNVSPTKEAVHFANGALMISAKTEENSLKKEPSEDQALGAVPLPNLRASFGLTRRSGAKSASNLGTSLSRMNLSDEKTASEMGRVNSIKFSWPPKESVSSTRMPTTGSLTPMRGSSTNNGSSLDDEPVIRLQNSLRPSTTRGNSFNDDESTSSSKSSSSWSSGATPDFTNLRPSATRGHSFDEGRAEKSLPKEGPGANLPVRSSSSSLDFTNHEVSIGGIGPYMSRSLVAMSKPDEIASSSTLRPYRPAFGRDGSFNKSPWANEMGTSWQGQDVSADIKIQVERGSVTRNPASSVDVWAHSKAKNNLKLDLGPSKMKLAPSAVKQSAPMQQNEKKLNPVASPTGCPFVSNL